VGGREGGGNRARGAAPREASVREISGNISSGEGRRRERRPFLDRVHRCISPADRISARLVVCPPLARALSPSLSLSL